MLRPQLELERQRLLSDNAYRDRALIANVYGSYVGATPNFRQVMRGIGEVFGGLGDVLEHLPGGRGSITESYPGAYGQIGF